MKCQYFREWALYGIKPVPTKPSVRQYWWPSVNNYIPRARARYVKQRKCYPQCATLLFRKFRARGSFRVRTAFVGRLVSGVRVSAIFYCLYTCHIYSANIFMPFSAIPAKVLVAQW